MKLFTLAPLVVALLLVRESASAPASDVAKASTAKEEPATTSTTTAKAPTPDHTHPPHTHEHVHTEDCRKDAAAGSGEYYDQRQNGTHNIRVEIDNIVILHAPLDMGSASTEGDEEIAAFLTQLSQLAEAESANSNKDKPSTTTEVNGDKVTDLKTQKKTRNKVRLANLLAPLLRHHV